MKNKKLKITAMLLSSIAALMASITILIAQGSFNDCPAGYVWDEKTQRCVVPGNWIEYTTRCSCRQVNVISCLWSHAGEGGECKPSQCTVCSNSGHYMY